MMFFFPDFSFVSYVQEHVWGRFGCRLRDGKNIGEAVTAVCHKAVQTDAWLLRREPDWSWGDTEDTVGFDLTKMGRL